MAEDLCPLAQLYRDIQKNESVLHDVDQVCDEPSRKFQPCKHHRPRSLLSPGSCQPIAQLLNETVEPVGGRATRSDTITASTKTA